MALSNDTRPNAAYTLANSPWFHHHKLPSWAQGIWDSTFAALHVQANAEAPHDACYASFLLHIDQHLPNGPDKRIAQWSSGHFLHTTSFPSRWHHPHTRTACPCRAAPLCHCATRCGVWFSRAPSGGISGSQRRARCLRQIFAARRAGRKPCGAPDGCSATHSQRHPHRYEYILNTTT